MVGLVGGLFSSLERVTNMLSIINAVMWSSLVYVIIACVVNLGLFIGAFFDPDIDINIKSLTNIGVWWIVFMISYVVTNSPVFVIG